MDETKDETTGLGYPAGDRHANATWTISGEGAATPNLQIIERELVTLSHGSIAQAEPPGSGCPRHLGTSAAASYSLEDRAAIKVLSTGYGGLR